MAHSINVCHSLGLNRSWKWVWFSSEWQDPITWAVTGASYKGSALMRRWKEVNSDTPKWSASILSSRSHTCFCWHSYLFERQRENNVGRSKCWECFWPLWYTPWVPLVTWVVLDWSWELSSGLLHEEQALRSLASQSLCYQEAGVRNKSQGIEHRDSSVEL